MKSRIYLDHAATTPARPAAIAAMARAAALVGNPASVHAAGRDANGLVEAARDRVAAWVGVAPDGIVFTSGGTEALALALHGAAATRVVAGATEHSAVLAARPDAVLIPVDGEGRLDRDALTAALAAGGAGTLVAVQQANNETGVVQDIPAIADMVAAAGARLLVDAVQAAGKLPLPDADYVALSAHKLGGPMGVGSLIVRDPGSLQAVQRGGGQERGLRGGTPNIPGIAGFAAALDENADWTAVAALREALEARLVAAGASINGGGAPRLPHIASVRLPGVVAATQVMHLDLAGFMVSAGAACSSGKVKASHVLTAMAVPAGDSIRVSLGWTTTPTEVDAFADAWAAMAARLGKVAA